MTPKKDLLRLAQDLENLDQCCDDPFERIQEIGKIWDQIRSSTPEGNELVSMLYDMLENYAHSRIKDTFFELAKYYEIGLGDGDDPDLDF